MEEELDTFHKKNTQQELDIAELKLKLNTTDKEMRKGLQKVCTVYVARERERGPYVYICAFIFV